MGDAMIRDCSAVLACPVDGVHRLPAQRREPQAYDVGTGTEGTTACFAAALSSGWAGRDTEAREMG
jgi:hypothetical protein